MAWHTTTHLGHNVYRISEPFGAIEPRVGVTTVNMYLIVGQERAALIDTGMGIGDVSAEVRSITSLPCTILNTHYHWDHTGGNSLFAAIAIHESEVGQLAKEQNVGFVRKAMQSAAARAALPDSFDPTRYRIVPKPPTRTLQDGDRIDLGGRKLTVVHIPGHSPGHLAYLDGASNMLFTGDAAYRGPVYACFAGGDPVAFARSARRLAALQHVTTICPGHDDIITEQTWLSEFAECVEAAVAGRVPGQLRDGFIVGREFRFAALAVWLPL